MADFPVTSVTLLAKIAHKKTGEHNEDAWVRFFMLYAPVIKKFAEQQGAGEDADDIVQDILVKLVSFLERGKYTVRKGRFRSFLATLIRRVVVDYWRRERARGSDRRISLDGGQSESGEDVDWMNEIADQSVFDPGEEVDAKWKIARYKAAVEHVLTKTALSKQVKGIYRAYVIEKRPIGEVAKQFETTRGNVAQVKFRVENMVKAVEAEMSDEEEM